MSYKKGSYKKGSYKKGRYKKKPNYGFHKLVSLGLLVVALIQFGKINGTTVPWGEFRYSRLLEREQVSFIAAAIIVFVVLYLLIKKVPRWQKRKKYREARMYEIDRMEGKQFEMFLAVYFKDLGYRILNETGGSGDMGSDLLIQAPDNQRIVVQAKRYTGKVPFKAIQEVHTAQSLYNAQGAIIISNNYFTKQSKLTAEKLCIELWDRNRLIENMYAYRKKKKEA